jgi:hypothetical protein
MRRQLWLALVGAAVLAAGGGCACCHHRACKPALDAGPECEVPLYERQQVYVVLVNGLTPCGLDGLRDRLNEQGWTKVYTGGLAHAVWLGREMRRVSREEPAARFVVVGTDVGAPIAAKLAADAVADQVPVEAVVLIDPVTATTVPGVRTLLVNGSAGAAQVPHTESLSLTEANRTALPGHTQTVAVVCGLLADVAGRVPPPPPTTETDWLFEDAPPVRSEFPAAPTDDPAWNFLLDTRPAKTTAPANASAVQQAGFPPSTPKR